MDSLVGYGSDDDNETERYGGHHHSGSAGGAASSRRRDDDTNYDDVNMDMSEESQGESEPELPPAHSATPKHQHRSDRRGSDENRERDRDRDRERDRERERERDYKRRDSPSRRPDRSDRRSPRRDDKYRSERERGDRRSYDAAPRRGLLGDRPDDRPVDRVPALMELRPFGGEPPPSAQPAPAPLPRDRGAHDARDAVSPRFSERSDRRDRDRSERGGRGRERGGERDRDRGSGERDRDRGSGERDRDRDSRRERSRGRNYPPPPALAGSSSIERRVSPSSGDYRPSSYKVNKKLEVMEKMGLQIKTPDGSMATAQQLRAAASDAPTQSSGLPSYYNPIAMNSNKILDQVQKRKLLWSNKSKNEAEEAAKWSGTRFAQDNDGRQVSKFMRLMGIKEPAAVKPESTDKTADPIKKQEELFQAMQAQYEVARATTHTMRGVGLGFQRGQF